METYQNLGEAAMEFLRGKLIVIHAYNKEKKISDKQPNFTLEETTKRTNEAKVSR